jgi:hypothetical protein
MIYRIVTLLFLLTVYQDEEFCLKNVTKIKGVLYASFTTTRINKYYLLNTLLLNSTKEVHIPLLSGR